MEKKYISPFAEITIFRQDIITASTDEEDDDIFEDVTIVDSNGNPVQNIY